MKLSPAARSVGNPGPLTRLVDVRTVPREKGIYAWWFTPDTLAVPTAGYAVADDRELLYVGIAPRRPSSAGKESSSHLRGRLATHARKDGSRSTLRLSLGVLLSAELGLSLGSHGVRLNWGPEGEGELTRWLYEHARISWIVDNEPWVIERELLADAPLSPNLDGLTDEFARSLSARRQQFRRDARQKV